LVTGPGFYRGFFYTLPKCTKNKHLQDVFFLFWLGHSFFAKLSLGSPPNRSTKIRPPAISAQQSFFKNQPSSNLPKKNQKKLST
jgi:hypothetical protein